ncbi:MAG: UDP-N-acetylmuramoyl-L-alanine--D-glutamate ligase [Firmicutes bacterium]|nr:UDP-N-acetylmuramoyl-L-alanine--D-glutamate ligase [Bacillota bacterium]
MGGMPQVGIIGLGVNNQPLVRFFLDRGIAVAVADRRPRNAIEETLSRLGVESDQVHIAAGEEYLQNLSRWPLKEVYVTPGMKKNVPEIHVLASRGTRITCETNLFLELCPAPVIGITGSAGKTTTTTLLGMGLKQDGRHPVHVGGNIGTSLLPRLPQIRPSDWVVMELSSFQLELVTRSPHGAAILNLSPNHLDIHGDFSAYRAAKAHIWDFQSDDDWALIPADDAGLASLFRGHRAAPTWFSLQTVPPHGSGLDHGWLVWQAEGQRVPIIARDRLKMPGEHNVANALAAIALHMMAGGHPDAISEVLGIFDGVPHRLEKVREHDSIIYINDSIATAPDRTMAALNAIRQPIILIAGGYDKHLEYETLGQAIAQSTVRAVIVLGQTGEKIAHAVQQSGRQIPVQQVADLATAVIAARKAARPGDVVLLSPASASYDMFLNFEERGQRFRELVQGL